MPTRLLHTQMGTLCSRDEQISKLQYNRLLSSAMSYDPVERVGRIHADVSRYFRFVMFSHRWGEGEPLLRDIQSCPIYDMTSGGFHKTSEVLSYCFEARLPVGVERYLLHR
ncbi:hypothetical protein BKA82DRAFT_964368 [Pisolithus tinctorius]|uniref:Uncharacterized protein n=1 Tax=Pisolithus tinctorius Marx 270 TaxID=870435 RepID=A0A0C3JQI5_PISTI|nr:hypothetical protein BKA82DRAFT_964368 [Pisolithus tinctorius]KIN99766.1 hypothetical protein M404DRAFT_964368 [Pisolithus tinctorius Marx 270]